MNWLARQLVEPNGAEMLTYAATQQQEWPGSPLRLVPFQPFREVLGLPYLDVLEESFALCEPPGQARERAESALFDPGELPHSFTVCLDWNVDTVFYLPEDRDDSDELQLFTDYGGWLTRTRVPVSTDGDGISYGEPTTVVRQTDDCEDGPCRRAEGGGAYACDPGCQCRRYELYPQSAPPRLYAFKCCR